MPETSHSNPPPNGTPQQQRRSLLRKAFGRLLAQGPEGGPPDIDEMWRDFTRKLSGWLGLQKKGTEPGSPGGFQPDARSAGIGAALVVAIIVVVWLFSGSFIVQEGQQAVVTTFGKYSRTVDAGWGWRMPYPFQAEQTVVLQSHTVEIGGSSVSSTTGLSDSAMLTQDENIVDVRFNVHYQLKDARAYLFENNMPDSAVVQAAESSVRELVGRSKIDDLLFDQHDTLAAGLVKSIQVQLDRIDAGIQVTAVNVESASVPDPVSTAFADAAKAAADRDSFKSDGMAYASDVIPKANGDAARLREDALAYQARVVGAAEGDADRFKAVYAEYQKAPGVTHDRMYIDTMQEIYANVTKVMVDTHGGTNVIQLPLDKIALAAAANASQAQAPSVAASGPTAAPVATIGVPATVDATSNPADARSRDNARSRDRDGR